MEASNVIPFLVPFQLPKNILETVVGNSPKSDLLKDLPKEQNGRLENILKV